MHSEYTHLFIAIEIDIKLVERLTIVQEDLGKIIQSRGGVVRWTQAENMHLTLKFLGHQDSALIPEIGHYINNAVEKIKPFSMNTAFIGAFPNPQKPRILYTSTDQGLESLNALQKSIEDTLAMYQFRPDPRPFMPHITLGRIKTPTNRIDFTDAINAIKDLNFGVSNIFEIALFGSNVLESRAQYTVLSRHPLGGSYEEVPNASVAHQLRFR